MVDGSSRSDVWLGSSLGLIKGESMLVDGATPGFSTINKGSGILKRALQEFTYSYSGI